MNEIKFEYPLIVFLGAYLNQIDLSLDRSRWLPLDELRFFYKTQISPKKVADFLIEKFNLNKSDLKYIQIIKKRSVFITIKSGCLRFFKNEASLTKDEIYYCCQVLLTLDQYLKSDLEIHRLEIEKLRVDSSNFLFISIKSKIYRKDWFDKVLKIEHLLESEYFKYIKLEELIKLLPIYDYNRLKS